MKHYAAPELPRSLQRLSAPAAPDHLACKCCGGVAWLAGWADFARDCYAYNAQRNVHAGIPVPYYRCGACEFGFTDLCDDWSDDDFRAHIYNDEYGLFDPNFQTVRPNTVATIVKAHFPPQRTPRVLDYGGGNGLTAQLLRDAGYGEVENVDPFHANQAAPRGAQFDLVICIEVAEHTARPLELFALLHGYAAPGGSILVSTRDFGDVKGDWVADWYVAPRNGHISFYTQTTLRLLAASMGRSYRRLDGFRHVFGPLEG